MMREIARAGMDPPRTPPQPPELWDKTKSPDVIAWVLQTYAPFRALGMYLSDLRGLDPKAYKAFSGRCFYLGLKPGDVFEMKPVRQLPTHGPDGKVLFPRKAMIGKSLTQEEYDEQRRAYKAQSERQRLRRRAAERSPS
jgi:hypothetical protein